MTLRPCKHKSPMHMHWMDSEELTIFECLQCGDTWSSADLDDMHLSNLYAAGYRLEFVPKGTKE